MVCIGWSPVITQAVAKCRDLLFKTDLQQVPPSIRNFTLFFKLNCENGIANIFLCIQYLELLIKVKCAFLRWRNRTWQIWKGLEISRWRGCLPALMVELKVCRGRFSSCGVDDRSGPDGGVLSLSQPDKQLRGALSYSHTSHHR